MNITKSVSASGTVQEYMSKVYALTFIGTLISFFVAFLVYSTPAVLAWVSAHALGIFVIQIAAVFALVHVVETQSKTVALLMYGAFTAVLGLTFSYIFVTYTMASILAVLVAVSAMFAGLSCYGFVTKRDLKPLGKFLFIGLLGLIAAIIVNIFLASAMLNFVISIIGVLVFAGLIVTDTQAVKEAYDANDSSGKAVIFGATQLYLDFLNLFTFMLSLFGIKK